MDLQSSKRGVNASGDGASSQEWSSSGRVFLFPSHPWRTRRAPHVLPKCCATSCFQRPLASNPVPGTQSLHQLCAIGGHMDVVSFLEHMWGNASGANCVEDHLIGKWKSWNPTAQMMILHGGVAPCEWLSAHDPNFQITDWCHFENVCKTGHVDLVQWVFERLEAHKKKRGPLVMRRAIKNASANDDLDVLKWFVEHGHVPDTMLDVSAAIQKGCINQIRYLLNQGMQPQLQYSANDLATALRGGFDELVDLLAPEQHIHVSQDVLLDPYITDELGFDSEGSKTAWVRIGVLERLLRDNKPQEAYLSLALEAAIQDGNLEVVKHLYNRFGQIENIRMDFSTVLGSLTSAIAQGHSEVVWFVLEHEQHRIPRTNCCRIIDAAVLGNQLRLIKFLHGKQANGFHKSTMDNAAAAGFFTIVQFLHENRGEDCSSQAMNDAARGGFLPIVKFLYENRSHEVCVLSAMYSAASNGHAGVVKFLRENWFDRQHALELALRGSHLCAVMGLLQYHGDHNKEQQALSGVCQEDQETIEQWLEKARIDEAVDMPDDYFSVPFDWYDDRSGVGMDDYAAYDSVYDD